MNVRFTDPDEFLAELRLAPPNVEPVLRATLCSRLDPQTGVFCHLTMIATYLRQSSEQGATPLVVRLESYAGTDWGPHFEQGRKARQQAEGVLTKLRAGAAELGLEIRAGVYEV